MRFTNERYVTKATDNAFDAGQVVAEIIDDIDPDSRGELETLRQKVSNLTQMASNIAAVLTDSQQRDLIDKYYGWTPVR